MRALVLALALLAGCSYTARFESEPSGAIVKIDGRVSGVTPCEISLPVYSDGYALNVEKDGYRSQGQYVRALNADAPGSTGFTFEKSRSYRVGSAKIGGGWSFGTETYSPDPEWCKYFHFTLESVARPAPEPVASAPPPPAPSRPTPLAAPEPGPRTVASEPTPIASPTAPASRFCLDCGKPIAERAKFCPGCGAKQ